MLAFSSAATTKSRDAVYLRALSECLDRPVSLAKKLALARQLVERRTNFKQAAASAGREGDTDCEYRALHETCVQLRGLTLFVTAVKSDAQLEGIAAGHGPLG